jgi:hypothetical protein
MRHRQSRIHAKFSNGVTEASSNEVKTFLVHQDWYQSGKFIKGFLLPKPLHSVDLGRPAQFAADSFSQLKVAGWQSTLYYLEVVEV